MKINQVSRVKNGEQSTLNKLIAHILAKYPLFQHMEFSLEPFSYDAYPVLPDLSLASSVRDINAAAGTTQFAPTKAGDVQKAYAFEFEIDNAYLNDLNVGTTPEGLVRQIQARTLREAKKVAGDVLNDMINGSGATKYILGIKEFVKDVADASGQTSRFGLTQDQIHSSLVPANIQLDLSSEVGLRTFDELLMRTLADMEGDPILVMNAFMFARMGSIAKNLGQYGETVNSFGKPVSTYGNHTMVPLPMSIMPQTESDGTNADCSSIYPIVYDEASGVRYATNTGFQFTDFEFTEAKPSGKSRLEFIGNTKIENVASIKRISRIRL